VYKDVGDFEVSVNDLFLRQVFEAKEDVPDDGEGFFFGKTFHLPEFRLEITIITQLSDDVAVSITCKYLIAAKNVGVIEFFEDFDFREEKFLEFFGFERIELNDLDGNSFV
jgi:hypothetical protein